MLTCPNLCMQTERTWSRLFRLNFYSQSPFLDVQLVHQTFVAEVP